MEKKNPKLTQTRQNGCHGSIHEQGIHDELLAQKGDYFKLQTMQATKGLVA